MDHTECMHLRSNDRHRKNGRSEHKARVGYQRTLGDQLGSFGRILYSGLFCLFGLTIHYAIPAERPSGRQFPGVIGVSELARLQDRCAGKCG